MSALLSLGNCLSSLTLQGIYKSLSPCHKARCDVLHGRGAQPESCFKHGWSVTSGSRAEKRAGMLAPPGRGIVVRTSAHEFDSIDREWFSFIVSCFKTLE